MLVLPPTAATAVTTWLLGLNYPWPSSAAAIRAAPPFDMLDPVLKHLTREEGTN